MINLEVYEKWMKYALIEAVKAFDAGEVPIGCIIVKDNKIIGKGYNQVETLNDATAHAEMIAITSASATINDWRLDGCTLYVTKEPCAMCSGAIINSRVSTIIFGAYDEKKGCCGSLYQLCGDKRLESLTAVKGGIEEELCSLLLKEFFKKKRS